MIKTIIVAFCLLLNFTVMAQENISTEKPKIIYVFDPMCGWCYAFGSVMEQFYQQHQNDYDFDVVTGGMVTGENQKPLSYMRDYIKGAIPRLEKMTGATFGKKYINDILEPGTYISSSEKPSFAFVAFKQLQPKNAIAFAHSLQKTFFLEGNSLNEDSTYNLLSKNYQTDSTSFINAIHNAEIKKATFQEFDLVKQWGISGFPAVVLFYKNKGYMVANGYTTLENLTTSLQKIIKQE